VEWRLPGDPSGPAKEDRLVTADYPWGMPDVPGLVVCRWCHLLGPDSPEGLIRLPRELEAVALSDGWRFEVEVSEWICPECIVRRDKADEN
jgi:hypothetical protein